MEWIKCPYFRDEKSFTTRFGKQINDSGGFFYKISDMDTRLKPFDAFAVVDGGSKYIEFKVGDERKSCDLFKKLRPNQKAWLRDMATAWWFAYVVYYNRRYKEYYWFQFFSDTQQIPREYSWKKN